MARYILIDRDSGYIFGDSADLGGKIFTGTPMEFAAALDKSIGVHGRTYSEEGRRESGLASRYDVYRADVGGSEAIPVVWDGQDQATIDAVERDCVYVTTIVCEDADD
jgi:hypothetical protein